MFTVKNFRVVYVNYVYYLTKIRDRNLEVNLLKLYFKMLVSRKINKHETKEYHKNALEKAKGFLELYEDPTKSVTHDENSDEKYERNIHIIKIIIQAVLLCVEQGIALRGHRE